MLNISTKPNEYIEISKNDSDAQLSICKGADGFTIFSVGDLVFSMKRTKKRGFVFDLCDETNLKRKELNEERAG